MLRLVVNSPESSEPVIPVRWCLDQEAIRRLADMEAVEPQIVISIMNDKREIDRVVAPLDQALAYVEFRNPGVNTLRAFIAWHEKGQAWRLKDHFMVRNSRRGLIKRTLYWQHDNEFDPKQAGMYTQRITWLTGVNDNNEHVATLDVNVPKEFFAAEPPEWEKRWVNLWYQYQPVDQCDYRRRRIWAYTVKPFAALIYAAGSILVRAVVAAFTLLMGLRLGSAGAVVRPFTTDVRDVWEHWDDAHSYFDRERSFILTDKRGSDRHPGFLLLHPLSILTLAGVAYGVSFIPASGWRAARGFLPVLGLLVAITIVAVILYRVLDAFIQKFGARFVSKERAETKTRASTIASAAEAERQTRIEREKREKETREALLQQRMSEVACDTMPVEVDVRALRNPSVTLRFQALKAKVCRPYVSS